MLLLTDVYPRGVLSSAAIDMPSRSSTFLHRCDRNDFGRPGTVPVGCDHVLLDIRRSAIADFDCGVGELDRGWVDVPGIPDVDIGITTYDPPIRDLRCC